MQVHAGAWMEEAKQSTGFSNLLDIWKGAYFLHESKEWIICPDDTPFQQVATINEICDSVDTL